MRVSSVFLVIATVIVVILLIGRFNFSEADFSMSNPAWNGISRFSGNGTINYLNAFSDLSGVGENSTVLIIGPTLNYTAEDARQIMSFMQYGGTVIIMDDFGAANTLLSGIASPITINQQPLCDDYSYYKRMQLPVITDINRTGLMSNVTELVLNCPASLQIADNATALAFTSPLGWVDENANMRLDKGEIYDICPVAARESYGKGELYVISDPDVLVNVMIDQGNNSVFASNIMASGHVYLDVSHGQKVSPLSAIFYMLRYDLVAQLLCSLLILMIGFTVYWRRSINEAIFGPEKPVEPVSKKQTLIDFMKAKFSVKERDIKELNKKL